MESTIFFRAKSTPLLWRRGVLSKVGQYTPYETSKSVGFSPAACPLFRLRGQERRIHRQQRIHMPRFQSVARHALPGVHFPERQRSRAKAGGWIGRAELPEPGPQMFQSRRDVRRLRDILGPAPGLLLDAGPELGQGRTVRLRRVQRGLRPHGFDQFAGYAVKKFLRSL